MSSEITTPYHPRLDADPDKVSNARRFGHETAPLGWDLYLSSLLLGMEPASCTLSSTAEKDSSLFF